MQIFRSNEYKNYFKILPAINNWSSDLNRINGGKQVSPGFNYSSNTNTDWMKKDELKSWIKTNMKSINLI